MERKDLSVSDPITRQGKKSIVVLLYQLDVRSGRIQRSIQEGFEAVALKMRPCCQPQQNPQPSENAPFGSNASSIVPAKTSGSRYHQPIYSNRPKLDETLRQNRNLATPTRPLPEPSHSTLLQEKTGGILKLGVQQRRSHAVEYRSGSLNRPRSVLHVR